MRIAQGFVHQEMISPISEAEERLVLITPYRMPRPGLTVSSLATVGAEASTSVRSGRLGCFLDSRSVGYYAL